MLSVKDVAEHFEVSEVTIRHWAAEGRLPGARQVDYPFKFWEIPESALGRARIPKRGRPKKAAPKKRKRKT